MNLAIDLAIYAISAGFVVTVWLLTCWEFPPLEARLRMERLRDHERL